MVPRAITSAVSLFAFFTLAACTQKPVPSDTNATAQQEVQQPVPQEVEPVASLPPVKPQATQLDHSGRKQVGRASYYAQHFANRKMANGDRLDPNSNVVASKSLPIGTTAKVTNPANGKSATVRVADRGPFVKGRVVDVTPKVADELGLREKGVAPVVVAPIAVPQANGGVKLGSGAAEASPQEVERATRETQASAH
jgi:rare lipoprotein A